MIMTISFRLCRAAVSSTCPCRHPLSRQSYSSSSSSSQHHSLRAGEYVSILCDRDSRCRYGAGGTCRNAAPARFPRPDCSIDISRPITEVCHGCGCSSTGSGAGHLAALPLLTVGFPPSPGSAGICPQRTSLTVGFRHSARRDGSRRVFGSPRGRRRCQCDWLRSSVGLRRGGVLIQATQTRLFLLQKAAD